MLYAQLHLIEIHYIVWRCRSLNQCLQFKTGTCSSIQKKKVKKKRKECLFSLTHSSATWTNAVSSVAKLHWKSNRSFFFRLQSVLFLLALKCVFMRGRSIKSFVLIFFVEFLWFFMVAFGRSVLQKVTHKQHISIIFHLTVKCLRSCILYFVFFLCPFFMRFVSHEIHKERCVCPKNAKRTLENNENLIQNLNQRNYFTTHTRRRQTGSTDVTEKLYIS